MRLIDLRDANIARHREWVGDVKLSLAFRGLALAGKLGEACNIMEKLERRELSIRGSRSTPAALAGELADIIICVDLIAMDLGINLGQAVVDKFNATSENNGLLTRLEYR